jgi:hypothetical protein
MILLICLNILFVSLVTMDRFCKSNAETDLETLHYITFIKSLTIFSTEALFLDSKQFTNNSINKVIETKTNDHFLLCEEHFFTVVLLYKKNYEVQFKNLSHEVLKLF